MVSDPSPTDRSVPTAELAPELADDHVTGTNRDVDGTIASCGAPTWPQVLEPAARSIDGNDLIARVILPWRLWPKHWWVVPLVAVVVYGPIEKFVLPALGGYLSLSGQLKDWRPDLEALQTGFIGFPAIYAFYAWSSVCIPKLLRSLHEGGLFVDKGRYTEHLLTAQERWWWFTRLHWTIVGLVVAGGLTFGLFGAYLWDFDDPKPVDLWFKDGGMLAKGVAMGLLFPVLYAGTQILIRESVLAWTLRSVWRDLGPDLRLRSKRDEVGGLRELAGHVTRLIWLVASVFITFAMASALPALRDEQVGDFVAVIVVMWLIYLLMVPGIFVALVWPAHRAMQRQRDERLAQVAARIDRLTTGIEQTVHEYHDDDRPSLRQDIADLEQLRQLHAWLAEDLATWPVPKVIRKQLTWSALLPIGSTLVPLLIDYLAPG
jgi:hypothetical protein